MTQGTIIVDQRPYRAFTFSGNAKDYFKIALVNLLLSIITIGIYSAWAKVRTRAYFLSHMKFKGMGFRYHATGWMILKGRLLALLLITVLLLASNLWPEIWLDVVFQLVFQMVFMLCLPFLLNLSLRFNARQTSWSTVHFNWCGTYWRTLTNVFFWPSVTVLSLGLLAPVAGRAMGQYMISGHGFGQKMFTCATPLWPWYKYFLIFCLWASGIVGGIIFIIFYPLKPYSLSHVMIALGFLFLFINLMGFWLQWIFMRNILYNATMLGPDITLHSNIYPGRYLWIVFSNSVLVPLSAFLLYPWAQIRVYRYLSNHTFLSGEEHLETMATSNAKSPGAFGSEFTALEGIDVGMQ